MLKWILFQTVSIDEFLFLLNIIKFVVERMGSKRRNHFLWGFFNFTFFLYIFFLNVVNEKKTIVTSAEARQSVVIRKKEEEAISLLATFWSFVGFLNDEKKSWRNTGRSAANQNLFQNNHLMHIIVFNFAFRYSRYKIYFFVQTF